MTNDTDIANDNQKPTIQIVDAIMGAGKTTWAHGALNRASAAHLFEGAPRPRYIYITPFLDEVDRVMEACPAMEFRQPEEFKGDRDQMALTKGRHFEWMVEKGLNIATTHALFSWLSPEAIQALGQHGYQLIIDEALDCFEIYGGLPRKQLTYLQKAGFIEIDEDTGQIDWIGGKHDLPDEGHRFEDVRRLCQAGALYWMSDKVIVWEFPRTALEQFMSITVLTYLFEGSTLAPYLRINGFPYEVKGIDPNDRETKPRDEICETFWKDAVRENLKLHHGTKNKPGDFRQRDQIKGTQKLTKTHLTNWMGPKLMKKIKTAVRSFLERDAKVEADKVGWTTFDAFKDKLKGPRYSDPRAFIPVNMRASNAYRDRQAMIYLANRFSNPALRKWIEAKGETIDEDLFALSELLQWLWRGCIRDNQPMHALVMSERMRALLEAWLAADTLPELRKEIAYRMGRKTKTQAKAA